MKHPKGEKSPKSKKAAPGTIADSTAPADILSARDLCKAIVDLKVKDKSYNELVDFCDRVLHATITKEEIAQVLLEVGKRAKHLNGFYDSLVKSKVKVIVVDEIFQGQKNCYLGSADPASRYLFLLEWVENRREGTLQKTLSAFAEGFENLYLVITDGLRQYGVVVPEAFDDAVHLLCQVHAFRIILREQEIIDRAARKAFAAKKSAEGKLAAQKDKLAKKRRQLKAKQAQLASAEKERGDYNNVHGIKPHAKGAPWTPERLDLKVNVATAQASARSKAATVAAVEEKLPKLERTLAKTEKTYQKKKQVSLQAGRLASKFKDLRNVPPQDFAPKQNRLEGILAHSKNALAPKVRKFLKDHPEVFATKVPDLDALCPSSAATTNAIESIFSLIRPLLRKARRFGATPVAAALFEVVRLRHNLTPPYTGPNSNKSPLEQVGVHSQYADYLDALFPPGWAISVTFRHFIDGVQQSNDELPMLEVEPLAGIAPSV